jgi:hypothetical protein
METVRLDGCAEYRWPLLCSVSFGNDVSHGATARGWSGLSPTPNPGNVADRSTIKIDRWLVQQYLRGSRLELKLNAVTAAPMAIAAAHSHLHRERAAMARPGGVQRTGSLPLHPDRFDGWKPSKFNTCSLVISLRTVSKSTPGTVVPHAPTAWLGAQGPFRSLSSP